MPWRTPPWGLAFDEHRVHQGAEIVGHDVADDLDDAGVFVHLDFADVAAIGEGGGGAGEDVLDVERAGRLCCEVHEADAAVSAGYGEAAGGEFDVGFGGFEGVRGQGAAFVDDEHGGFADGLAAVHDGARTAGAAAGDQLVAVALDQADAVEGDAEAVHQHLGERGGMALAVIERPRGDGYAAVWVEADAAHFLVGRGGYFQVVADADAATLAEAAALVCGGRRSRPSLPRPRPRPAVLGSHRCRRPWWRVRDTASGRAGCGCGGAAPRGRCPFRGPPCRPGAPCSSCPPAARRRDRRRRVWCW